MTRLKLQPIPGNPGFNRYVLPLIEAIPRIRLPMLGLTPLILALWLPPMMAAIMPLRIPTGSQVLYWSAVLGVTCAVALSEVLPEIRRRRFTAFMRAETESPEIRHGSGTELSLEIVDALIDKWTTLDGPAWQASLCVGSFGLWQAFSGISQATLSGGLPRPESWALYALITLYTGLFAGSLFAPIRLRQTRIAEMRVWRGRYLLRADAVQLSRILRERLQQKEIKQQLPGGILSPEHAAGTSASRPWATF